MSINNPVFRFSRRIGLLLVLVLLLLGASRGAEKAALPSGPPSPRRSGPQSCLGNPAICNASLVSVGSAHTIVLKADGTVWGAGANDSGQLGDGTIENRYIPVRAELSNVMAVVAGDSHTVVLKQDRTVWAFGWNGYGQLGDGTTEPQPVPTQVLGLADVVAAAASYSHTMVVKGDGTVWGTGSNAYGELGDGTFLERHTPVQIAGLGNIIAVAAEYYSTVALQADGTVWTFGWNGHGQLGDGTKVTRNTPEQVPGLSGVIAVASGTAHTVVLKADGTVWTFGANGLGQLGDGTTTDRLAPVMVNGLSDVTAISAGEAHTVVLKADGTVWAFGLNDSGQLGDGTTTDQHTPQQIVSLSDVVAVSANLFNTAVLEADGTVWTFGWNGWGQLGDNTTTDHLVPEVISEFYVTPAGECHEGVALCDQGICAFPPLPDDLPCDDGDLCTQIGACQSGVCLWQSPVPCPVPPGGCHKPGTCDSATGICEALLKDDGALCDDGDACTTIDQCEAGACSGTSPVVCAALDACHGPGTCDPTTGVCDNPAKDDGTVCDDGNACTQVDRCQAGACVGASPVLCPAPLNDCHKPATCAPATGLCDDQIKSDGATCDDGDACTHDDRCQSGLCEGKPLTCPAPVNGCHEQGSCDLATGLCDDPLKDDGYLCDDGDPCTEEDRCLSGECRSGSPKACAGHLRCDPVGGDCLASCASVEDCTGGFVCDESHHCVRPPPGQDRFSDTGCAVVSGGATGESEAPSRWCGWTLLAGLVPLRRRSRRARLRRLPGLLGALGVFLSTLLGASRRSGGEAALPVPPSPQSSIPASCTGNVAICNAGLISAGQAHTATLRADGTVWTFGEGNVGQLGNGATFFFAVPVHAAGFDGSIAVAASGSDTVALHADGTLLSVGLNDHGQLGDGTTTNRSIPVQVLGLSNVIAVTVGRSHVAAVKSDGTLWAFGRNDHGQLGDGTTIERSTPAQVAGLSDVIAVAAGGFHTVALKADGTLWAFGQNDQGQLGDGTTTDRWTAVPVVGLSGVIAVAAGKTIPNQHTVAVLADGTVWAFGRNEYGQLGNGTSDTDPHPIPAQIPGLDSAVAVAAGGYHTLVVKADGAVLAFGRNTYGELGDGTTTDRHAPVQVAGLGFVVAVATGTYHSVALQADGAVRTFGANNVGELGNSTITHQSTPVTVTKLDLAPSGPCNNGVAACDQGTGACVFPLLPNGTSCDEGDLCTQPGTCQADACVGQVPISCAVPPDDCHNPGTCDPASGACGYPLKDDTVPCDDHDACTQLDQCKAGVCTGTNPVPCAALDDCHKPGTCDPSTGKCDDPVKLDGAFCDDGDMCTQLDQCEAGACTGTNPVVCAAVDACHKPAACDPMTGVCQAETKDDGVDCDDGNACTHVDRCDGGVCAGVPVVCPPNDGCHKPGTCDLATGLCDHVARDDGYLCDDGDPCTEEDRCEAGQCQSGAPKACAGELRCDTQTGDCLPSCASVDDCVDGFVCDGSFHCVAPPPDRGRLLDAGCAVASGTAEGWEPWSWAALLGALAGLFVRRRRRAWRALGGSFTQRSKTSFTLSALASGCARSSPDRSPPCLSSSSPAAPRGPARAASRRPDPPSTARRGVLRSAD